MIFVKGLKGYFRIYKPVVSLFCFPHKLQPLSFSFASFFTRLRLCVTPLPVIHTQYKQKGHISVTRFIPEFIQSGKPAHSLKNTHAGIADN